MLVRLEHANLCVRDIDGVIAFLQTAFPEFAVRHDSTAAAGTRWVHVGTNDTYVALYAAATGAPRSARGGPGMNHLAYEVHDVEALRHRLLAGGYTETPFRNAHPHRRRIYFRDPDDNEWEFVQYFSDDPALRHDYELADV